MKNVFIFLPEAGIYEYLRSLSIFGNALLQNKYQVYLIKCNGILSRCPMQALHCKGKIVNDNDKNKLCKRCNENIDIVLKKYQFKLLDLENFINKNDLLEISNLLKDDSSKWDSIIVDNFKIGQISIHDLMIETQVLSIDNLTVAQKNIYSEYIFTMAKIMRICENIIQKMGAELFLTFNPYAQCQAVQYICQKNNVRYISISNQTHLGANASIFQYTHSTFTMDRLKHIQNFSNVINKEITYSQACKCFEDSLFRMYNKDSHIFSTQKKNNFDEIMSLLQLDPTKKTFALFTSSYDEILGMNFYLDAWGTPIQENNLFKIQYDWLVFMKNYATKHSDIQVIVRIHPREANNGKSEHVFLLEKHLVNLPCNYKIIWPENPISSYDLMENIDLCLISNSTVGLECLRLGIPVLGYVQNFNYPNEGLFPIAKNLEEYERILDYYRNNEPEIKQDEMKIVARYYYWITFSSSIVLSNYVKSTYEDSNYYPKIPIEVNSNIYKFIEGNITLSDLNKKLNRKNGSKNTELDAILLGIRQLLSVVMTQSIKTKSFNFYFLFRMIRKMIYIISFHQITIQMPKKTITYHDFKLHDFNNCKSKKMKTGCVYYKINTNSVDVFNKKHKITLKSKMWIRLLSFYRGIKDE